MLFSWPCLDARSGTGSNEQLAINWQAEAQRADDVPREHYLVGVETGAATRNSRDVEAVAEVSAAHLTEGT